MLQESPSERCPHEEEERWRFNDGGFKHIAQKAEHISKGSVLALSSGGWSLKRLFLCGSAALVPCLPDLPAKALYNHLPHQVKRDGHYKVYTRTSA